MNKQNDFSSLDKIRIKISHEKMKKLIDDEFKALEENTYTEEQMKECWETAFSKGLSVGFECYKPLTFEEYIQSLKQHKQ